MIRLRHKRGIQGNTRQRAITTHIGAETQQHQRFGPPGRGQQPAQRHPEPLDIRCQCTDRQGAQGVSNTQRHQRTSYRKYLAVRQRPKLGHLACRPHHAIHGAPVCGGSVARPLKGAAQ
ncbi:Uncharacterised protein [Mycobacteroides abscessus subsp. abscessus]|nr:Uncharacterised protein [Mycobacteroides abscessus subsp. abscessus]